MPWSWASRIDNALSLDPQQSRNVRNNLRAYRANYGGSGLSSPWACHLVIAALGDHGGKACVHAGSYQSARQQLLAAYVFRCARWHPVHPIRASAWAGYCGWSRAGKDHSSLRSQIDHHLIAPSGANRGELPAEPKGPSIPVYFLNAGKLPPLSSG